VLGLLHTFAKIKTSQSINIQYFKANADLGKSVNLTDLDASMLMCAPRDG